MALSPCATTTNEQGRELVAHGTPQFPAACYHDDLQKTPVPWHWHDELELVLVTEGTVIAAADDQRHTLSAGDGFFINAGVLHAAWTTEPTPCRFHSIVFHPRLVGGAADSIFWQQCLQPLLHDPSQKMICLKHSPNCDPLSGGTFPTWKTDALDHIEAAWQACDHDQPGFELQVRHHLSQLMFLLSQNSAGSQPPSRSTEKTFRDGQRIKIMLQYIQNHYFEELTIGGIAASAAISESECLRCFHNTIGTTPIQYLKEFRLQRAADLLLSTDWKIGDIGERCGFQEMSYFARCFRQQYGVTPGQFRTKK